MSIGLAERIVTMTAPRLLSPRFALIAGAVLLAAVTRMMPHPDNFTPMAAMALFGAATLTDKRLGLLIPMLALFISDLGVEVMYDMGLMASWGIYPEMWTTYVAFLLVGLIGLLLRRHRSIAPVAAATLAGSVVFFCVSNFLVWAFWGMYPLTLDGLVECYTLALPFYGNTLLGDVMWSTVLFGGFALAELRWPVLRDLPAVPAPQEAAA
jgi:hypothetical protein